MKIENDEIYAALWSLQFLLPVDMSAVATAGSFLYGVFNFYFL